MTPADNNQAITDDIALILGLYSEESSRWITGQAMSAIGSFSVHRLAFVLLELAVLRGGMFMTGVFGRSGGVDTS